MLANISWGNFLIGLREGLEASLVVSILVAYVVKTGHRRRLHEVWIGVAAALTLSLAFGALLAFTSSSLSFTAQEAFGGIMSILAVGLVTWMIFWMKRQARFMKKDLEGKLASALALGPVALMTIAFFAVAREGLETSLFMWSAAQATSTSGGQPLIGALLGLLTAATLGYLIYRSAISVNLAKFFKYTGIGLVLVAAGVLAYGFHDLQEAGWVGGISSTVFDISAQVPLTSWYGVLLKGAFNFNPAPTWVELTVWLVYLGTVLTIFLWPSKVGSKTKTPAPARPVSV